MHDILSHVYNVSQRDNEQKIESYIFSINPKNTVTYLLNYDYEFKIISPYFLVLRLLTMRE